MASRGTIDAIDIALFRVLIDNPRATAVTLASAAGVARNTVHARLNRWDEAEVLHSFDRRIDPATLGFPLRAYVFIRVEQRSLAPVSAALREIIEVIAVDGLSGDDDLLSHVVARDAGDLYRIAGQILSIGGVERTRTSLVMRELIAHRSAQLLQTAALNAAATGEI
jgi:DNA-binding Lrp family transcriptional regulator